MVFLITCCCVFKLRECITFIIIGDGFEANFRLKKVIIQI